MSKRIFNLVAITALLFVASSCKKDAVEEPEATVTSADVADIKTIVQVGEWKISHYFDSESDRTSDYTDFRFKFNENGVLGATDDFTALSGAWKVKSESSTDVIDFDIHFSSSNLFKKLSEGWQVKKYTDAKIELIYTSSEEKGTALLTFQK